MPPLFWHEKTLFAASPAPATLVTGDSGGGGEQLATALAAKFNGGAETGPDILHIALPPDKSQISVDAVRGILYFFSLAPVRGERRVALILQAEKMHNSAANMLLKTLEEPNANRCVVLSARTARQLPATIISRCRVIAAPRPTLQQAQQWLRAQDAADSPALLAYCGNRPLAALNMAEGWPALITSHLKRGADLNVAAAAADFAKNAPDGDWLDGMQKWAADIARTACRLPAKFFPADAAALQTLAAGKRRQWLDFQQDLYARRALFSHPLAKDLFLNETLYAYRQLCAAA